MHAGDLAPVLRGADHSINARSVDAAVSQHIRQMRDILILLIKGPSKQMPQVVRKHLVCRHTRRLAKPFHQSPDIAAVHRGTAARDKHAATADTSFAAIAPQTHT